MSAEYIRPLIVLWNRECKTMLTSSQDISILERLELYFSYVGVWAFELAICRDSKLLNFVFFFARYFYNSLRIKPEF